MKFEFRWRTFLLLANAIRTEVFMQLSSTGFRQKKNAFIEGLLTEGKGKDAAGPQGDLESVTAVLLKTQEASLTSSHYCFFLNICFLLSVYSLYLRPSKQLFFF